MAKMNLAEIEALFGFGQLDTAKDTVTMGAGAVAGAAAWQMAANRYVPMKYHPGGEMGWVGPTAEGAAAVAAAMLAPRVPGPRLLSTAAMGASIGLMAGSVKGLMDHFGADKMLPASQPQQSAPADSGSEAVGYLSAAPIQIDTEDQLSAFAAAPIEIESVDQLSGFGAAPIEISSDEMDLAGIAVSY